MFSQQDDDDIEMTYESEAVRKKRKRDHGVEEEPKVEGDYQGGLVYRTSKFYNNQQFSDVEFIIDDGINCTTIYAHKQILTMASEGFATLFSEYHQPKVQLKINENPKIVTLVLSYLYTDELNLKNIDEAVDVLRLAEKFKINELKGKCQKYIILNDISLENVLNIYEIALKENIEASLKKCRDLVSRQTAAVLALPRFREASVKVVQDILALNQLSVGEKELLSGLMLWVKRDCAKRGRPTENICLRDSISPLLPYIRILTLSFKEFYEFMEEYEIFTTKESIKLTKKILDPRVDCGVPSGFCPCTVPRSRPYIPHSVSARTSCNLVTDIHTFRRKYSTAVLLKNKLNLRPRAPMTSDVFVKNIVPPPTSPLNSIPSYTFSQNGAWEDDLNRQAKPLFQLASAASSAPPVPAPVRRSPVLKIMNNQMSTSNQTKTYDFPLQEMQLGLNSISKSDIICSAELNVIRGSIAVFGVELKVLNLPQYPEEAVSVYTQISGDVPEKSVYLRYKLVNNRIQVIFKEPLRLNSGNQSLAKIEITIEDLTLNRCKACRVSSCEINSGLNLTTVVKLRSNQPNQGDGFFYFISGLLYG